MKNKTYIPLGKRATSCFLTLCLIAGVLTSILFAFGTTTTASAEIGSNVEIVTNNRGAADSKSLNANIGTSNLSPQAGFTPETLTLTPGKNTSEIGVTWYSDDTAGDGKVKFGSVTVDAASGTATKGKKWHKATINGLNANTAYVYSVSNDGTNFSSEYTYTTPGTGDFTFAAVGDPQLTLGSQDATSNWFSADNSTHLGWAATASAMFSKIGNKLSFIAGVGDQVDLTNVATEANMTQSETQYSYFFEPDLLRSVPFAPAVGNHDRHYGFTYHYNLPNEQAYTKLQGAEYGNASNDQYADVESKGNYYYTYNNALFVVLNDSTYPQNKTAAEALIANFNSTLSNAISANPGYTWLFVQHHKSTASVADHIADRDIQYYVEAGFEKLMDNYEVDFVLGGHDHVYARSYPMKNGVPDVKQGGSSIDNPNGTIYMTFTTASGIKYYELFNAAGNLYVKDNADYPYLVNGLQGSAEYMKGNLPLSNAKYLQAKKPAFTSINVTATTVTFETYNVDDLTTAYDAFTVTKTAAHKHDFGSEWKKDATGHWYECACGEKDSFAPHTPGEWIVDTDATSTIDGNKHKECTVCGYITGTEVIPATGEVPVTYNITGGANGSWKKGSASGLTITSSADFTKFTGIRVDNTALGVGNYTAVSGSTIVTFSPKYMETLSLGSHTIELVFKDGTAKTNLTILAAEVNTKGKSPQTGDSSTSTLWLVLNGAALIVLVVLMFLNQRRKREQRRRKNNN